MNRNGLLVGIAAVLLGITVLMLISGLAVSPVLLFVAIPFGAAAALIWYHASGRLADRVRSNPDAFTRGGRGNAAGRGSAGSKRASGAQFGGDSGRQNRRRSGASGADGARRLSRAEAARILDVETSADGEAIKRAYRTKVKTSHPDAPDGDEETFKSVRRAYERLSE